MKVIYPIRAALVALYRVDAIYARDVRGRARFHPERKADENALAVNNVGRASKARTRRLQGDKINLTPFHLPFAFSASSASRCPRFARFPSVKWKHPHADREKR